MSVRALGTFSSAGVEATGDLPAEMETALVRMLDSQARWASLAVRTRLRIVRKARYAMAARAEEFAAAISPSLHRTKADTLASELMPLLDACRFLEREAHGILKPRYLGWRGRPLWLAGVDAEIHREPVGRVLIIGPSNFPLFLPGVQVMQALTAGNAVLWKPGEGGRAVAKLMATVLAEAGLPGGLLRIAGESAEAGERAIETLPDKVVFTGSSRTGRTVLQELAATATPAVLEMSGADALIVLDGADLRAVAKAAAYGLRLNGGAVCMSPRRLLATTDTMQALRPLLDVELEKIAPVALNARTAEQLEELASAAVADGAVLRGEVNAQAQRPLLVDHATPLMNITRSDVFAPVLSLIEVRGGVEIPEAYAQCGYGLTASIFCAPMDEMNARRLAHSLRAGVVLINDVIAPTADPRVPFGGRGESGYGVTRGAEGLLEMTVPKVLLVRVGGKMRHLEPTRDSDVGMMAALVRATHGSTWRERWNGMRALAKAGRNRQ